MHKREFSVRGGTVSEVPRLLYEKLKEERKGSVEQYEGERFDVIVVERYYLRNNSDQQATIVFERVDEGRSLVTIIAGGGGTGLFQISLGSHSTQTKKLTTRILEIYDSAGIQVEQTN